MEDQDTAALLVLAKLSAMHIVGVIRRYEDGRMELGEMLQAIRSECQCIIDDTITFEDEAKGVSCP